MSAQQKPVNHSPSAPSFWRLHWQKGIALLFWGGLLVAYNWYLRRNHLSIQDGTRELAFWFLRARFAPLLYVVVYALRPLILFPATLISVLAGFLFGPVAGVAYSMLGSNSSAMVAYLVGRFFGRGLLETTESGSLWQKYADRMRANGFEAVLLMRLLFLPYDLVNYLAGFLRVDWRAFLLATIIGTIPGTISFVLFGASFGTLDELLNGEVQLNVWSLGASVGLVLVSLWISRVVRRREGEVHVG
ncbi:MAG: TVP38/TMEM64 family protein [Chloroflexi bacterium]|nr:MAG: TVP38/TMEM64 family protein [Chloroflexota bacterium]